MAWWSLVPDELTMQPFGGLLACFGGFGDCLKRAQMDRLSVVHYACMKPAPMGAYTFDADGIVFRNHD